MKTKQQEELIRVLHLAQNALGYYIDGRCREEEYMWYEVLDGELDILETFGEESEAQEVVKLIRGLKANIDKESEKGYLPDSPTRVSKLEKSITKNTNNLILKIEHQENLKVESGTYEITYNITGRGGATIEILEGEEVVDIVELYLLDTGMNLDDREVTITGIKKA